MTPLSAVPPRELFPGKTVHARPQWLGWGLLLVTLPLWGSLYLYLLMWLHTDVLAPLFGWPEWFPEATRAAFQDAIFQWLLASWLPQGG